MPGVDNVNPTLLFVLRFLLPAALIFSSCVNFSLLSLPFFVSFLVINARPSYTFKKGFPIRSMLFLFCYALLNLITQIICAVLIATSVFNPESISGSLDSVGIARFDISAWRGIRTIIGSFITILVLLAACLISDNLGGERHSYFYWWFFSSRSDRTEASEYPASEDVDLLGESAQTQPGDDISNLSNQEEGRSANNLDKSVMNGDGSVVVPEFLDLQRDTREAELSKFTIFLAAAWAFQCESFAPSHSPRRILRWVNLLRIYTFLYLLGLFVVQIEWLVPPPQSKYSRYSVFVGLVPINTSIVQGWSYVMAFSSAVFFYVFTGLFSKAVRAAFLQAGNLLPGDPSNLSLRFVLSAREVVLHRSIMHASSIALLSVSLVFPGIASLPIMIFAFLYFVLPAWRQSRKVDYFIFYLIFMQLMYFIYSAITDALSRPDSTTARLLGFRRFRPQFGMNVSQAIAIVLFCFTIYLKRYLAEHPTHNPSQSHDNGENAQDSHYLSDNHLINRLFFRSEYSAVSRGTFSPLRVIIDQFALASLYISGAANASVLNVPFLLALTLLCLSQSFKLLRKQKVFSTIWLLVLIYASGFLMITSSICRSATGLWKCDYETIGVLTATTIQVIAYAFTVAFAAVQFHFTWPWSVKEEDTDHVHDFRSGFWTFLRGYFIFFAYVALLLYPLGSPANYLSYAYLVFLLVCILIEILLRGRTIPQTSIYIKSRDIIGRVWIVIVIFSCIAMLARYILRFPSVDPAEFVSQWVFGLDRGSSGFALTLGDAVVLITMSLQSRLFAIDKVVTRAGEDTEDNVDAPLASTVQDLQAPTGGKSDFLTAAVAAFSAAATEEEKAAQAARLIRKLRNSLPVVQTYETLRHVYRSIREKLRRLLFRFSYVFEALAVLAAAIWLDGISLFGAVYLVLGCILVFSNQRPRVTRGGNRVTPWGMRILPPTLAGLSFSLMSLQYLYMIFTASGKSWSITAEFLGLQEAERDPRTNEVITGTIPITQEAILAHALVFTMAFLQRATKIWAKAEEKKRQVEDGNLSIVHAVENPESNANALASAVSVSDALPGVRSITGGGEDSRPDLEGILESSAQNFDDGTEDIAVDEIMPRRQACKPTRDGQVTFALDNKEEHPKEAECKSSDARGYGARVGGKDGMDRLDNNERNAHADEDVSQFHSELWAVQGAMPGSIRTRQGPFASTYGTVREMTDSLGIPTSRLNEMIEGRAHPPDTRAEAEEASGHLPQTNVKRGKLSFLRWRYLFPLTVRFLKGIGQLWTLLTPFWSQWGFDITYMYLVIGGTITRTVFSTIYIAFVFVLCAVSRKRIALHWSKATLVLITLMVVQYLLSLGLPRSIGPDLTWVEISTEWAQWLYLDRFNQSAGRKADLTVGFLAVICAGITLDAVRNHRDKSSTVATSDADELSIDGKSPVDALPVTDADQRSSLITTEENSADDQDFTRRPLSRKYWVKLQWMKSSGSLVQLFMFVVAVVNTNVFGGFLLLMAFYYFSKFSNMATKQARFNVVRFYVLAVILVLMIYQAPFGNFLRWARILGLYKVTSQDGRTLIYMMVTLWVLSQMQGRVYESEKFRCVIEDIKRSEGVRFTRALHEHQSRMYQKMLDFNELTRARNRRADRLERLKILKTSKRGVDALYEVCVKQEIEYIKKNQPAKDVEYSEEQQRKETVRNRTDPFSKFVRFVLRGKRWWMFEHIPLWAEFRRFVGRRSTWPLYFCMILAVVQAPSIFSLVYPVFLFLYLIPEQPRPPKAAWTFLMFYVYGVILFKYWTRKPEIVQTCKPEVSFFGVKSEHGKPDVREVNICKLATGIFYDILVLLSLLWHRMFLYYRGLWDLYESEENLRLRNRIKGRRCQTPAELCKSKNPKHASWRSSSAVAPASSESVQASTVSSAERSTPRNFETFTVEQQLMEADRIHAENSSSSQALRRHGSVVGGDALYEATEGEEVAVHRSTYEDGDSTGSAISENRSVQSNSPRDTVQKGDGVINFTAPDASIRSSAAGKPYVPFATGLRKRRPPSRDPMSQFRSFSDIDSNLQDLSLPMVNQKANNLHLGWFSTSARPVTWNSPSADASVGSSTGYRERSHGRLRRMASRFRSQTGQPSPAGLGSALVHSHTLRTLVEENRIDEYRSKHRRNDPSSSEDELDGFGGTCVSNLDPISEGPAEDTTQPAATSRPSNEEGPTDRPTQRTPPRQEGGKRGNTTPAAPLYLLLASEKMGIYRTVTSHFRRLLQSYQHKAVGDYYLLIFATDFVCFVYMIFGYSYMFSQTLTDNDVNTWWSSNFISTRQLLALLGMFLSLIFDRIIYLKRSMAGKLILHYVSVVVYHYILFMETSISQRISVKIFYVIKCIYFLLSGLQMRLGFPQYTTGQYLLRNYSVPGLVAFEIYNYVPFLWLMRTLLDWVVLPTSLEIFQYFRFVDIYTWLYRNRAINQGRGKFHRVLGEKRRFLPRLYQGYGLFILCVLLLFFPFLVFSFFNPFFSPRVVRRSVLSMKLSPSPSSTYEVFSRSTNISGSVTGRQLEKYEARYKVNAQLRERERIYVAKIPPYSQIVWNPAPPDLAGLIAALKSRVSRNESSGPKLSFTFVSETNSETFRATRSIELLANDSISLLEALEKKQGTSIYVPRVLARYWLLTSGSSTFRVVEQGLGNVCIRLHYEASPEGGSSPVSFWSVSDCVENCPTSCKNLSLGQGLGNDKGVGYLLQIADVSSISLGGGTIITVFSAILFTIASLARSWFSNKRLIVPYIDMPYTLHLYQLVNDVLYARQDNDLEMEEILYNGLIDLYRDPSALVKWTGERRLKSKEPWWNGPSGYTVFPSHKETDTEPYIRRVVD